jgi:guanylate kinase
MPEPFKRVVVLFGGPATGKDTVSRVLSARGLGFEHFTKLKVGPGNRRGYFVISQEQLEELRKAKRILSEVTRYGAVYAIDCQRLAECLAQGKTPLVHTADLTEVVKLHSGGAMIVVMECSRETARYRLEQRDCNALDERLSVWDSVAALLPKVLRYAHVRIDTDELTSDSVADKVITSVALHSLT